MQTVPEATSKTLDTSLKVESLLLEELRRLNENASQSNRESSGTYNVYLIWVSIITMAVGTLQIFVYNFRSQGFQRIPSLLNIATIIVLIFGGILSFIFLLRFLQLVQRELHNIVGMNKIRAFYINYLKPQMPTLEEAFYKQDDTEYFSNVPSYIRYTVSLVGSLGFGGAFYLILDNLFIFQDLFWSICVFVVSFFLQQWYYQIHISKFRDVPSERINTIKQASSISQ